MYGPITNGAFMVYISGKYKTIYLFLYKVK